jgi:transposase
VQELLGPNGLIYAVNGENDEVHILWGGRLYYTFHRSNSFEKNLGIAILARLGVVQQTIADLFAVERHTVRNILSIYDKEGLAGLQAYKVGRRGVGSELQSFEQLWNRASQEAYWQSLEVFEVARWYSPHRVERAIARLLDDRAAGLDALRFVLIEELDRLCPRPDANLHGQLEFPFYRHRA